VAIGLKLERLATAKAGTMLNGNGLNSLSGKGQVFQQAGSIFLKNSLNN
jgi:hypothetical protein